MSVVFLCLYREQAEKRVRILTLFMPSPTPRQLLGIHMGLGLVPWARVWRWSMPLGSSMSPLSWGTGAPLFVRLLVSPTVSMTREEGCLEFRSRLKPFHLQEDIEAVVASLPVTPVATDPMSLGWPTCRVGETAEAGS